MKLKQKIAIIGYGYVGKAMKKFFENHYELVIYDPPAGYKTTKDEVDEVRMESSLSRALNRLRVAKR